jgi:hypothetical protein
MVDIVGGWSPRRLTSLGSGHTGGSGGMEQCEVDGSCYVLTAADLNIERLVKPQDGMMVSVAASLGSGNPVNYDTYDSTG